MGKRYKEFVLDIIAKSYQLIFGAMIISPIVTKTFDLLLLTGAGASILILFVWAGAISRTIKEA